MIFRIIARVGLKSLLSSPTSLLSSIDSSLEKNYELGNHVLQEISKSHQKLLASKKLSQQDKLANFLCDLHLQNTSILNSGIYDEYSWMYSKHNGQIWLSRAWMWAIQSELGIKLLPDELFFLKPEPNKHIEYSTFIHNIHRATYNIMNFKGIQPTFSVIYRNVIEDNRVFKSKYSLTKEPMIEYNAISLEGVLNIRCCSLKPHACENYDFSVSENTLFVVARGMEEVAVGDIRNALPTVLFTFNHKDISRFKSNAEYKDVLVMDLDQFYKFIYLYEP